MLLFAFGILAFDLPDEIESVSYNIEGSEILQWLAFCVLGEFDSFRVKHTVGIRPVVL